MEMPDPSTSQWADRIILLIGSGGMLAGLVSFLNWISNRKKPSSEIAALNAETDVKLSSELRQMHGMLSLMESAAYERQQENLDTIKYYRAQAVRDQAQIEYFENLDKVYRDRGHALNGELGRLVLALTNLGMAYLEKTGEKPTAIEIRTYDEIVKPFPLPAPPRVT
jgi:hypothetical protein